MTVYANKGLASEQLVELSNQWYRELAIATVHKVPTEWKPIRRGAAIVSAKVERKAAVDFLGVWNGHGIAFDVKECSQPRWPLRNLEPHQRQFLYDWVHAEGLAFILIVLKLRDEVYCLPFEEYHDRFYAAQNGGPKSLTEREIRELPRCVGVPRCPCDYLTAFRQINGDPK